MSESLQHTLLVTGRFDPSLPGFIIAATWPVLETSLYLQICMRSLSTANFCWNRYEPTRKVQEFNESGRQNALANKPPGVHLSMADTDKVQMA